MHRILASLGLMTLIFILSAGLVSAQLFPVSLEEKVVSSNIIAEGKVVKKESFWNASHTMIYTANKIEIYKIFKGKIAGGSLTVLTEGGAVGDDYIEASHLLSLDNEAVGMFFCIPNRFGLTDQSSGTQLWETYGSQQGFLAYNLNNATASAPFASYASIKELLYPQVEKLTALPVQVVNNAFSPSPSTNIVRQSASISGFTPATVWGGAHNNAGINTLTINGTGFGIGGVGKFIVFKDGNSDNTQPDFAVAYNSNLVDFWTDTQIRLKVPSRAATGLVGVVMAPGDTSFSLSTLNVFSSVLTAEYGDGSILESRLMNANGNGGYTLVYSTSTAGSGINITQDSTYHCFRRALATWQQVVGINITEGGNTTNQNISVSDRICTIMFDNSNTGNAAIPAGVIAITYSRNSRCSGSPFSQKLEFDMVINNKNYSGALVFPPNKSFCTPLINTFDMESIMLHELGHAFNLAHIYEPSVQTGNYLTRNPAAVMHATATLSLSRKSLDGSAYIGGVYSRTPQNNSYGSCGLYSGEMAPLIAGPSVNDECSLISFPTQPTPEGASVNIDLALATSNRLTDPQYRAIGTAGTATGNGVSVTNNVYHAIKTSIAGDLIIGISNYNTLPEEVIAQCAISSVRLAVYQTASCPTGQNFPAPVFATTIAGNGNVIVPGLQANTNYLLFFEGTYNTKAIFTATFGGAVLPLKIQNFYGVAAAATNELYLEWENTSSVRKIVVERSADGVNFSAVGEMTVQPGNLQQFTDQQPPAGTAWYRLHIEELSGSIITTKIVLLRRLEAGQVSVYPNPVQDRLIVNLSAMPPAQYQVRISDVSGRWLYNTTTGSSALTIGMREQPVGMYILQIMTSDGKLIHQQKLVK